MIYLDYAAAAPLTAAAREAFLAASKVFGNPAAAHALGRKLAAEIEEERAFFLSLFASAAFENQSFGTADADGASRGRLCGGLRRRSLCRLRGGEIPR